jgi:tellurite resistance protein TehA-like permease
MVMILLRWALEDYVSPELSSSVRRVASPWIFALVLWSLDVVTGRPALSLLPGRNLGLSSAGWQKVTNAVLVGFIAIGLWGAVVTGFIGPEFRKSFLVIGSGLILAAFTVPLYKAMVRLPERFEADCSKAVEPPSIQP